MSDPQKTTEMKWDGTRLTVEKHGNKVELVNRHGVIYTVRLPGIRRALMQMKEDFVLDGEVVYVNPETGREEFTGSQKRCSTHYPDFWLLKQYPLVYKIFDMMMLKGKRLENVDYFTRKAKLEDLLDGAPEPLEYVPYREDNVQFFEETKKAEAEGLIAKDIKSGYRYERSWSWLKIKNWRRIVLDVVGFTEGKNARTHFFGSLVLAENGKYRGKAGSGFNDWELRQVKDLISDAPRVPKPFDIGEPYTAIEINLRVKVKYYKMTSENRVMREPVFVEIVDS